MRVKITDRNTRKEYTVYDGHWHSSPRFAYRLSSRGQSLKVLKRGGVGVGPPDEIGNKLVHRCAYSPAKLFQTQVCCSEFVFEPVSETKNSCHSVCVLSKMLQQQSEEDSTP